MADKQLSVSRIFRESIQRNSMSPTRLDRLCSLKLFGGASKETIIETYMEYGLNKMDAKAKYDNMVECLSKFIIHGGTPKF